MFIERNPMKTTVLIDWIAATLPVTFSHPLSMAQRMSGLFPTPTDTWALSKPMHGYKVAIIEPFGILCMSHGSEKMGTHVILSGSTLNKLADAGFPRDVAIENLIGASARFSRIDLALDAKNTSFQVKPFYEGLIDGSFKSTARNFRLITNATNGATLYLGSPTSEKMIRIYDKANEQGVTDYTWVRIEAQLSGTLANNAARAIAQQGLEGLTKGVISQMIPEPDIWLQGILEQATEGLEPSGRKLTNRAKWLLEVCAPALAEAGLVDRAIIAEFWEKVQEVENKISHRHLSNIQ